MHIQYTMHRCAKVAAGGTGMKASPKVDNGCSSVKLRCSISKYNTEEKERDDNLEIKHFRNPLFIFTMEHRTRSVACSSHP